MKQTTFNFKSRFASAVERGVKRTTIRLFEKTTPPDKGDTLKLFTGMRTKKCRKLKQSVCRDCLPIQITEEKITLGKRRLSRNNQNSLAIEDGFESAADMRTFFRSTYGLPLPGKPHWVSWR